MAEVQFPEVKDRNVATPSRVRITKAVGIEGDNIYDVEAVPGTVYEEGTPLNEAFFTALKNYIDNNLGSPDNPVPIENGGTGANTAEGARANLGVYSTTEVDEIVERTGAKIEPHINAKITDTPEGVHGFYVDENNVAWIDPSGSGEQSLLIDRLSDSDVDSAFNGDSSTGTEPTGKYVDKRNLEQFSSNIRNMPDNQTIQYSGSPKKLSVIPGSIDEAHLNPSLVDKINKFGVLLFSGSVYSTDDSTANITINNKAAYSHFLINGSFSDRDYTYHFSQIISNNHSNHVFNGYYYYNDLYYGYFTIDTTSSSNVITISPGRKATSETPPSISRFSFSVQNIWGFNAGS